MNELANPSEDLKARILGEVSFEKRLTGFVLSPKTGPRRIFLYSFQEALGLLFNEHPRIDYCRLADWIGETIGDVELAGMIGKVEGLAENDYQKNLVIRGLMAQRLLQCQKS